MMSKFSRNSVITGCLDAFCLVCECRLWSTEDIQVHIEKPIHKKNLESAPFLNKYPEEGIRKVKKGYYCEFCNMLLPTAAKVGLHVNDCKHNESKGEQLVKRVGDAIIVFDNIQISERAWNGLNDNSCNICNTEFSNENIHKTESTHILNLIQSSVKFRAGKIIYRQIDDDSFHCLTCDVVLATSAMKTHFEHSDHHTRLLRSEVKETNNKDKNTAAKNEKFTSDQNENSDKISKVQDANKTKNDKTEKAVNNESKTLSTYNGIENKPNVIEAKKIDQTQSKAPKESEINEAITFAKKNKLIYNRNANVSCCEICNTKFPSTLQSMKDHVDEVGHKIRIEPKKKNLRKTPMKIFVDTIQGFETIFDEEFIIVNNKYTIKAISFMMMTEIKLGSFNLPMLRCQACEINLVYGDKEDHMKHPRHRMAMAMTAVLCSFVNEFVREVRHGLYHCGFCNIILANMSDLENHLKSFEHDKQKSSASILLDAYRQRKNVDAMKEFISLLNFMRRF